MEVTLNLLSVKTKDTESQQDLITDVNWEIVVTKSSGARQESASMQLSSGMFDSAPEDQFISYNDLTDDQILEWAKSQFADELLAEYISSLESTVDSKLVTSAVRMKIS